MVPRPGPAARRRFQLLWPSATDSRAAGAPSAGTSRSIHMFATLIPFSLPGGGPTLLGVLVVLFVLAGVRYIPNKRVGIVEKRWSRKGSVKAGFIALNGEAGYQPE